MFCLNVFPKTRSLKIECLGNFYVYRLLPLQQPRTQVFPAAFEKPPRLLPVSEVLYKHKAQQKELEVNKKFHASRRNKALQHKLQDEAKPNTKILSTSLPPLVAWDDPPGWSITNH